MFVGDIILLFRLQRLKNLAAIAYLFFSYKYPSLECNLESLQNHLLNKLNLHFNLTGVSETRIRHESIDFNPADN